jgi:hypothetical protein
MGNSISRQQAMVLQDSLDLCNKRLKKVCAWMEREDAGEVECDALTARLLAARVPVSTK